MSNSDENERYPRFVRIPAGVFIAGDRSDLTSLPRESHSLQEFAMTACEITVAQYAAYVSATAQTITNHPQLRMRRARCLPKRGHAKEPITHVSLGDAQAYAAWLSQKMERSIHVPSEQAWEYASRARVVQAPYPWGWGTPDGRAAWQTEKVISVGCFPPNGFDLYDMSGGVSEWCLRTDGEGGEFAVIRGGAWSETLPDYVTVYKRLMLPTTYRGGDVGFRLVRDVF